MSPDKSPKETMTTSKDLAKEPDKKPIADSIPPQITNPRADTLSTKHPINGAETKDLRVDL